MKQHNVFGRHVITIFCFMVLLVHATPVWATHTFLLPTDDFYHKRFVGGDHASNYTNSWNYTKNGDDRKHFVCAFKQAMAQIANNSVDSEWKKRGTFEVLTKQTVSITNEQFSSHSPICGTTNSSATPVNIAITVTGTVSLIRTADSTLLTDAYPNQGYNFATDATTFFNERFVGSSSAQVNALLWPYTFANESARSDAINNLTSMLLEELERGRKIDFQDSNQEGKQAGSVDVNSAFCPSQGSCASEGSLRSVNMKIEVVKNTGSTTIVDAFPSGIPDDANINRKVQSETRWSARKLNLPAINIAGNLVSFCNKAVAITSPSGTGNSATRVALSTCPQGSGYYKFNPSGDAEKAELANMITRGFKQQLPARAPEELRLTTFNVGSGNCAILECPHQPGATEKEAIILDCGVVSSKQSDFTQGVTPYVAGTTTANKLHFEESFFRIIDAATTIDLVSSHSDEDHILMLAKFLDDEKFGRKAKIARKLRNTYFGGPKRKYKNRSLRLYQDILNIYKAKHNKTDALSTNAQLIEKLQTQHGAETNAKKKRQLAAKLAQANQQKLLLLSLQEHGDLYFMEGNSAQGSVIDIIASSSVPSGAAAPVLGAGVKTKPLNNDTVHTIPVHCGEATVRFLAANSGDLSSNDPKDLNANSIVTYIQYGGKQILMAADASSSALETSLHNAKTHLGMNLETMRELDVLSVPHHGSESAYHYTSQSSAGGFPSDDTGIVPASGGFTAAGKAALISNQLNFQSWVRPKHLLYQAGGKHSMPFARSFVSYLNAFPAVPANSTLAKADFSIVGKNSLIHYFAPGKRELTATEANAPAISGDDQKIKKDYSMARSVFISSDNGDVAISIKNDASPTLDMACLGPFLRGGTGDKKLTNAAGDKIDTGNFSSHTTAWENSTWCLPKHTAFVPPAPVPPPAPREDDENVTEYTDVTFAIGLVLFSGANYSGDKFIYSRSDSTPFTLPAASVGSFIVATDCQLNVLAGGGVVSNSLPAQYNPSAAALSLTTASTEGVQLNCTHHSQLLTGHAPTSHLYLRDDVERGAYLLGSVAPDMQYIADELAYPRLAGQDEANGNFSFDCHFPLPGGKRINILHPTDSLKMHYEGQTGFDKAVNLPWLVSAMSKGKPVYVATTPYGNIKSGSSLTPLGRQIYYLEERYNLRYDPVNNKMVSVPSLPRLTVTSDIDYSAQMTLACPSI